MNDRNNLNKVIANDRQDTLRKEEIVNEVNQTQINSQTNSNEFKDERPPFRIPDKYRNEPLFIVFSKYWANQLIRAGFQIKNVAISHRDSSKFVYIFYNDTGLIEYYENLVNEMRKKPRKEDKDDVIS